MKTSTLELDQVRSKTRVTRMVSRAPLRLLETGLHDDAVEIQLATYGGGILQGPAASRHLEPLHPFLDFTQYPSDALPQTSSRPGPEMLCALNDLPYGGYVLRCLARTRRQLQPVIVALSA